MKTLYRIEPFKDAVGKYHVICDELVGTGRGWIEPARVLGIKPSDFLLLLKNTYKAELTPYKKDGKVVWVGYCWANLDDVRTFKNMINKRAREKKHLV